MFELHASPGFVPRLRGQVNFGTNDNTCYFILFFPINFLTPRHNHATLLLKVAKEEKRPSAECMDDHWWRCSGRNHEGRDLRFSAHFPSASHCIWIASNTCRFSEESYLDTNTCEAVLSSGSGIFFDPDIENGTRHSLVELEDILQGILVNWPPDVFDGALQFGGSSHVLVIRQISPRCPVVLTLNVPFHLRPHLPEWTSELRSIWSTLF